jgi:hypothetical protein
MNQLGEKLMHCKAVGYEFNPIKIHDMILMSGTSRVWSWGHHRQRIIPKKAYIFKVNGDLHKGSVVIVLNCFDLFRIYYTDADGVIKNISDNIFIDDLVETIHKNVKKP